MYPPSGSFYASLPSSTVAMSSLWQPTTGSDGSDGGGGGDGGKGGKTLQNWSSLIGIVTAIIGNILIALALNVQRYAHTRLHKERATIRRKAREALKRGQNSGHAGSYGTVSGYENGSSLGDRNGAAMSDENNNNYDDDNRETDPLNTSFHSSTSTEGCQDEETERQARAASSYLKSPYWWLGQILITLGEMGNFLAYGFAPASIVSPLGVVALISNCLIAPLMFNERFRLRDFWGVVIAVGGVVTVVLSANTQENKLNPHDVWGAITTLAFEIYLGVTVLLIILLMWASPRYGKQTILIDLGLVGLFGGYTALATKGVSSMLSSTLWRAFATPVTYVLVFILLGTAIMQIRYVNKALQRFDSTQVIPIQFVMFTLCVILGSAILYRDFEETTAEQAGKFVGGCLLTFFGVFLITSGRPRPDDVEDILSEADGVEETIGLAHQEGYYDDVDDDQGPRGSMNPSRRSSKTSRPGYQGTPGAETPGRGYDVPSFRFVGAGGASGSPGAEASSYFGRSWDSHPPSTPPPPGRGVRTLSADTLMRGSAVMSTPVLPKTPEAGRDGQPSSGNILGQPVTPQTRANTFGPSQHHRSGTFISPSPLASTVTTVMKDGFLRHDKKSIPSKSSMRHLRSRIRASLFFNEDGNGEPLPASENDLTRALTEETTLERERERDTGEGDGVIEGRLRSRSLSDALGDFFKSKKRRRKDDAYTDVEQGDSVSGAQPGPSS